MRLLKRQAMLALCSIGALIISIDAHAQEAMDPSSVHRQHDQMPMNAPANNGWQFMQLAAIWRVPITASTGLTVAGAPVGEPALGPVAFMHRPSAADNPTAPLGHHTFDSTHISFGVITAAVDHGPFVLEGSVFNGREPDDHRWDFDFAPLDSFSGRVWYRPTDEWEFQVSSGRLKHPEELEPGNIVRTTASASWTRLNGAAISAVTMAFGRNDTDHGARHALLVEGARHADLNTVYGRFEAVQVETALLQTGT